MDDTIKPPFSDLSTNNLSGINLDFFANLNFTVTPELTSMLSGTNIDFTKSTAEVLSAVSSYFVDSMNTMIQGLSTPIIHPWDALKMTLFEPEYKFSTIDDVVVPEDVTPESLKDKIKEHEQAYRSRVIDCIANRDKYTFVGPFDQISILSEPSGTNCFAVTQEKYKGYIEAVETILSIKPESVTVDNYQEYITKINYCVANMLSRKTVN